MHKLFLEFNACARPNRNQDLCFVLSVEPPGSSKGRDWRFVKVHLSGDERAFFRRKRKKNHRQLSQCQARIQDFEMGGLIL